MNSNTRKRGRNGGQTPQPKKKKSNNSPPTSTAHFPDIWKRLSQIKTSSPKYDDHSESSEEGQQDQYASSENESTFERTTRSRKPYQKKTATSYRNEQSSSDEDDIQSLSDDIALTSSEQERPVSILSRVNNSLTDSQRLSEKQEVFRKYGYPGEKESCFACSWGRCPTQATSDLIWNGLIKLYQERVGRCRRLELCETIHEYYEEYIRKSNNFSTWTIPMIHEHFFKHVKDLRVVLPQIQGDLANLMREYVDYMGECDDEGKPGWMSNPKIIAQARVAANMIRGMSKDIGPVSSSMMLPETTQNVIFVDYQTLGSVSDSISY